MHAADIQDADGAGDVLRRLKRLYPWLRVVFADSVYDRVAALLACFLLGLTLIVIRRLAGAEGFVLVPRRWLAERTLGWLGRWCRLAKDDEALPEVSATMVKLAIIRRCCIASPIRTEGACPRTNFANGLSRPSAAARAPASRCSVRWLAPMLFT